MTKLPRNLKPKKLVVILKKLGFEERGRRGSHIRMKHSDGRWTQVAIHLKPVPQGTLRKILGQIEMSSEEIRRLL